MIDLALQLHIYATAMLALHLLLRGRHLAGCIVGLAGQPAWLWVTWHAGQGGILAVSLVYTALYGKGVWDHYRRAR